MSTLSTLCMDAVSFGKRLRQLRTAAGLTRAQLAEKAGLKLRTIEAWEQGRGEPLVSSAIKLASALEVDLRELAVDPPDDLPEPPRGRPKSKPPSPPPPRRRGRESP